MHFMHIATHLELLHFLHRLLRRHSPTEQLYLFQHSLRRLFLLVRWVAVFAQDSLDDHA